MKYINFTKKTAASFFLSFISITASSQENPKATEYEQLDPILVETKLDNNISQSYYLNTQQKISKIQINRMNTTTLGNAVEKVSGIQSNTFGPNSSRPIIRGLSGQRLAILENSMPIHDLSIISGNLAIPINPINAEEIEITKSGANVLYGSRGMGGSINILDQAIPKEIFQEKISGKINVIKGINSADQGSLQINLNNGEHWAAYLSTSISKISSIKIPHSSKDHICYDKTYLQSRTDLQRQCQVTIPVLSTINPAYFKYISQYYLDNYHDKSLGLTEDDKYTNQRGFFIPNPDNPLYVPNSPYYMETFGDIKEYHHYPTGKIPNSHNETQTFTLGTSYIDDFGYSGLSWHYFNTDYGVPGFAYLASKASNGYAPVAVKNQSHRFNWDTHWKRPLKHIDAFDFQVNYQHSKDQELLGRNLSNGFVSDHYGYRVSITHSPILERIVGTLGSDFSYQKVRINGQDSYLPDLTRKSYSLFAIETLDLSPFMLELGHRMERVSYTLDKLHTKRTQSVGAYYAKDKLFILQNSHLALQFNPTEYSYIKMQRTFAERALDMNELYSNNNHYALLIEEHGDARLQKEKNKAWEISVGIEQSNFSATLNWYKNQFKNYTYLGYTSIVRNGLMAKNWRQTPLELRGWEIDLNYKLNTQTWGIWNWHIFFDHIQQKLPHRLVGLGNYLPNFPSSRFGGDLSVEYKNWQAFLSAIHYKTQKNVSNEVDKDLTAPSFTLVDIGISYSFPWKRNEIEVYFNLNNLTNREARSNTSSLKFLTPLPGRNATLGLRINF